MKPSIASSALLMSGTRKAGAVVYCQRIPAGRSAVPVVVELPIHEVGKAIVNLMPARGFGSREIHDAPLNGASVG
jgi:hypothetical protein